MNKHAAKLIFSVLFLAMAASMQAASFQSDMFAADNGAQTFGDTLSLNEGKSYVWSHPTISSVYIDATYRDNQLSYSYQRPSWSGAWVDDNHFEKVIPGNGIIDPFTWTRHVDDHNNTITTTMTVSGWEDYSPQGATLEVGAPIDGVHRFHLGSDIDGEYEVVVNHAIETRNYDDNSAGDEVSGLFRGYLSSCPPSYGILETTTDPGNDPSSVNAVIDGGSIVFTLSGWQPGNGIETWVQFKVNGSNGYGDNDGTLKVNIYRNYFTAGTSIDGTVDPSLGGWVELNVTTPSLTKQIEENEHKTIGVVPGEMVEFNAACDGYVYEFVGWEIDGARVDALDGLSVFMKTWEELLEMGGYPSDAVEGPTVNALFKAANKSSLRVKVKGEGNAAPRLSYLAIGESVDVYVTEWCAPFVGFEVAAGDARWELTNTQDIGLGNLAVETHRYTFKITLEENETILRAVFDDSGDNPPPPPPDDDEDDDDGTDWPDDDDDDDDDYEPPPPPPGQVYLVIGTKGDGSAAPNQVNVAPDTPVQVTFQELGASFKGPVIQAGEATMEAVSQSGAEFAANYVYNIAPHTDTTILAPFVSEEWPPTVTTYSLRISKRGTGVVSPVIANVPAGNNVLSTMSELDSDLIGVEVVSGRADLALLSTEGADHHKVHRYGVGGITMNTEILATFQDVDGPPAGTKYKLTVKKAGAGTVTPTTVQVESWQRVTVVCQESSGIFKSIALVDGIAQIGSPSTTGSTQGARTISYPVSGVSKASTLLVTYEGGSGDDDDDGGTDDDDDDGDDDDDDGDDDDDSVNPAIPAAGAAALLLLKQKQRLYRPHWSTERPDTPYDAKKRGE
jgi:hypothetical protein